MIVDAAVSRSPIHEDLVVRGAEWRSVGGIELAVRFQDVEKENVAMRSLGLCDLSGLRKFGVKGRDAAIWLTEQKISVPPKVFESRPLGSGGMIVRFGTNEFFLEDGIGHSTVSSLAERMDSPGRQVFRVEHQEATFLLTGLRSHEVLAQTCGINFAEARPRNVIFTRMAGVSCGIFPDALRDIATYRIWVDPSYSVYLWETLVEICESLDGSVIGASCVHPELLS